MFSKDLSISFILLRDYLILKQPWHPLRGPLELKICDCVTCAEKCAILQ